MTTVVPPLALPPLVVVSVLNWNTPALTLRCLRALAACDYPVLRLVVVDNASEDDSVAQIRAAWPDITLLRATENRGFAEGHALALAQARTWNAAALWLLNSDAEPERGALQRLIDAWQAHGDAIYGGAPLCPTVEGRQQLNFPHKYLDAAGRPRPFRRDRRVIYDASWATAPPRRVGAVAGSCLLLPLRLIDTHGWLDPAWFLYCEEIDYCYRLRARGVACWLVPQARVWHAGGGSTTARGVSDAIAYYHARNEIVLARRHTDRATAGLIALKKLLRALALAVLRPRRAAYVLRGLSDALRGRRGKVVAPERARPRRAIATRFWLVQRRLIHRLDLLRRGVPPRRAAYHHEQIGAAWLVHPAEPPTFIAEYLRYCVALLRERLRVESRPLWLVFGDSDGDAPRGAAVRRIGMQWEHTLVRPGGRDSADAPAGAIALADGSGHYLVRIARLAQLERQDLIIDYSRANRINIERGGAHGALLARLVVIAPLLHAPHFLREDRPLPLICLFGNRREARRAALLAQARRRGSSLRQVDGIFDTASLERLYRSSRVLLNVHQTADHHTAEELRILPALQSGMIVVSEDVPLREELPYHAFVIWATYEDLLDTAAAVLANYEAEHARLFGDGRLARVLAEMERHNHEAVAGALRMLD
ncbi:glycosyltransferase family 2 protein [Tahibacter sp.]|uniref:glycosyltransferase family 2 protein n=1 Tax=Tahibacter sp. TaxID=2056211 RepID=UPI0028C3C834|nr:glycosyltransferase family 2 protein [Tahibacter sp.]